MTQQEDEPETTEEQWLQLGHPIHLFIDTSVFQRLQFLLARDPFQAFVARLQAGDVRLLVPEVIRREVLDHVAAAIREAEQAHAKFKRDASILRNFEAPPSDGLLATIDWPNARASAMSMFESFFASPGVDILSITGDDAGSVFNDYFEHKPPFGSGKKKSEFPDSFALKALLRYGETNKCHIGVLSQDPDWKAICAVNPILIPCDSLEAVIEQSQEAQALLHDRIHTLLEQHRAELEDQVSTAFDSLSFYWDSEDEHDADIEDVHDVEVKSWPWSIIQVVGGLAEVSGDAKIRFRASASYPDPDASSWDSESKEMLYFGSKHATLVASVTVPISFEIDVQALDDGDPDIHRLTINNNADLWFSADVENVRADDYSK